MIKRLIFDVDNTLIEWKSEYWNKLEDVLEDMHIEYSKELIRDIINSIDTYEQTNEYYNKEKLLDHINKTTNSNFNIDFLNAMLKKFETCVPNKDEKIVETLEYLSKKYELVILTNWFKNVQINRLKNFGILNFFNEVFAGETFKIKPFKESFKNAMENRQPEECIMIGDNIKTDIQGAINARMQAIYINNSASKDKQEKYKTINTIQELKTIL